MKILLFGKDGQLGWELQRSLAPLGQVIAIGRDGREGLCGDFMWPAAIATTVQQLSPDLVVNAAAFTGVDAAEREREAATLVNTTTPTHIARAARTIGARVLHFSTEHVFDGTGHRAWMESDEPAPLNRYGRTKRDGEVELARHCPQHLIVRTSWLHSGRRANSVTRVLEQALAGEPLAVVDDQVGAPTSASLLADVAAHMVRAWIADAALAGTYHATAAGEASRFDCARFALAQAAELGLLRADVPVQPLSTTAWSAAARRPANSRLDTDRLRRVFQLVLPPWQQGVARTVQEFGHGRARSRQGGWT